MKKPNSLNQEIQAYKELIYRLAKIPLAYQAIKDFSEKHLKEILKQNRDIERTTDIKTFFKNVLKDNRGTQEKDLVFRSLKKLY